MGKYVAYPEYKDSGIEWVGDIPVSWEMWKLSHAYSEIGSGTTPPSTSEQWFGGDIPWVTTGELRESVIKVTNKKVSKNSIETFSALRVYPIGSVAMAMYGATIGRLGIFGVNATTNQACCVMTKSDVIYNKYLYYWLWAFRQDIINLSSGGGQPNINQEKVASLKISAPEFTEQTQIANFLDHETAKIDTLIEKQQQLIKLLKEKRQAVISHAVTKGLNSNAPMKDSGVEWVGEVPEHWIVKKLKYACELISEKVSTEQKNVIALENIESWSGKYITTSSIYSGEDVGFVKDDILFGKLRPYLAKVFQAKGEGVAFGDLIVFRPLDLLSEFCFYLMISEGFITTVDSSTYGSKMPRASTEFIAEMFVLVPPQKEQVEIAQHIQSILTKYDKIESEAIKTIRLMQERRTALISAAVTGKIDVRNWEHPND
ncbi:MAG: restriction endonuclease subunit S [Pseudomonadota bacterium]